MDEELLATFLAEAAAFLEETEEGLLALEDGSQDPEIIHTIFRHMHSLKGSAGYFGFDSLVRVAHTMESVLDELRRGTKALSPSVTEGLIFATDFLRRTVAHPEGISSSDPSPALSALGGALEPAEPDASGDGESAAAAEEEGLSPIARARGQGRAFFALALAHLTDLGPLGISQMEFLKRLDQVGNVLSVEEDDPEVATLPGLSPDDLILATEKSASEVAQGIGVPVAWVRPVGTPPAPEPSTPAPRAPEPSAAGAPPSQGSLPGQEVEPPSKTPREDSVRIRVRLLDDLLNLAGEMVLARNALFREMGRGAEDPRKKIKGLSLCPLPPQGDDPEEGISFRERLRRRSAGMDRALGRIDLLTTEFREKVMQARLQPLDRLFSRLPRLVRDLSRTLGKSVRLALEGGKVELDRSLLEALGDPLIHLVRNALDHGLEFPDERIAAGKAPTGTLTLKAWSRGGRVHLDVFDDGRGLDLDRIRARALERGLASDREIRQMVPDQISRFIFHPGFSTAASISAISGRGVGMDVVLHNVESLGGSVDLHSSAGEGTSFRISLPLTLAVLPSLLVSCGPHHFALPQAHVDEALRLRPAEQLRALSPLGDARVLRLRNSVIPAVVLQELLHQVSEAPSLSVGPSETSSPPEGRRPAPLPPTPHWLVLRTGDRLFALGVDRILGSEEILVKPLPPRLKGCRIYGGATVLGDERIALILDPEGIAHVTRVGRTQKELDQSALRPWSLPQREERDLLLVRGAGGDRFALDLSLIARIDEIPPDAIQHAGGMTFASLRGTPVRLLPLEDFMGGGDAPAPSEKRFALTLRFAQGPVAILVHAVLDTLSLPMPSLAPNYPAPGAFGTFDAQGHLVIALDPFVLLARARPPVRPIPKNLLHRRILLLDDDPFGSLLEQSFLQGAGGCEVLRAEDLDGARSALEGADFHALLVTPRLATPEALPRLRRPDGALPPSALLTGSPRGAPPPGYDGELSRDDREALLKGLKRLCAAGSEAPADGKD